MAIIDFCLKHLHLSGRMDRRVREEHLTVPFEVVKEATINMLAHRTWGAENATPSVVIYDDRMVFLNPGHFPIGYSWQDFLDSQIGSLPENPAIANVFYRCGMMESWGHGIELIIKTCVNEGLPKSAIDVSASFVNLTIFYSKTLNEQINEQIKLTERQKTILEILRQSGDIAQETISKKLNVSYATFRRDMDFLKDNGFIERVSSKKNGVWVVK